MFWLWQYIGRLLPALIVQIVIVILVIHYVSVIVIIIIRIVIVTGIVTSGIKTVILLLSLFYYVCTAIICIHIIIYIHPFKLSSKIMVKYRAIKVEITSTNPRAFGSKGTRANSVISRRSAFTS